MAKKKKELMQKEDLHLDLMRDPWLKVLWLDEQENDTSDYWAPTAANAIRPLRQMISLAEQCPDSIWDGD